QRLDAGEATAKRGAAPEKGRRRLRVLGSEGAPPAGLRATTLSRPGRTLLREESRRVAALRVDRAGQTPFHRRTRARARTRCTRRGGSADGIGVATWAPRFPRAPRPCTRARWPR